MSLGFPGPYPLSVPQEMFKKTRLLPPASREKDMGYAWQRYGSNRGRYGVLSEHLPEPGIQAGRVPLLATPV
jgi:hypothetical protein